MVIVKSKIDNITSLNDIGYIAYIGGSGQISFDSDFVAVTCSEFTYNFNDSLIVNLAINNLIVDVPANSGNGAISFNAESICTGYINTLISTTDLTTDTANSGTGIYGTNGNQINLNIQLLSTSNTAILYYYATSGLQAIFNIQNLTTANPSNTAIAVYSDGHAVTSRFIYNGNYVHSVTTFASSAIDVEYLASGTIIPMVVDFNVDSFVTNGSADPGNEEILYIATTDVATPVIVNVNMNEVTNITNLSTYGSGLGFLADANTSLNLKVNQMTNWFQGVYLISQSLSSTINIANINNGAVAVYFNYISPSGLAPSTTPVTFSSTIDNATNILYPYYIQAQSIVPITINAIIKSYISSLASSSAFIIDSSLTTETTDNPGLLQNYNLVANNITLTGAGSTAFSVLSSALIGNGGALLSFGLNTNIVVKIDNLIGPSPGLIDYYSGGNNATDTNQFIFMIHYLIATNPLTIGSNNAATGASIITISGKYLSSTAPIIINNSNSISGSSKVILRCSFS